MIIINNFRDCHLKINRNKLYLLAFSKVRKMSPSYRLQTTTDDKIGYY